MNFRNFIGRISRSRITHLGIIEKSIIYKFLPKKAIIVEAGAHIGLDTIQLAQHFPNGKIYAFEPVSVIFEKLYERISSYKNVTPLKIALSDRSGKAKMFISSGVSDGSSSLLPPKEHLKYHPEVIFDKEEIVDCITLDDLVLKEHLEKIDLLWLDLQGKELSVLKASTSILDTITVIYTEINLKEVYDGAPLYYELREWLENKGFKVYKEAIPWEDSGNVLFIRK